MKRATEVVIAILAIPIMGVVATSLLRSNDSDQTLVSDTVQNQQDTIALGATITSSSTNVPVYKDIQPEDLAKIDKSNLAEAPRHSSDILARVDIIQNEFFLTLSPDDTYHPTWFWSTLGAEEAWDISTGSSDTIVAVIDSGFALDHEDLNDGWWTNSGEIGLTTLGDPCWIGLSEDKTTNACDDDDNGYIDDWRGYDFANSDNSSQAGEVDPEGNGVNHGTIVTGFIGATSNNALGLPGLNWSAKIMPLQALTDVGSGFTTDIVAAIEYAVDNGADIINLSISGSGSDPSMEAAVSFARSQGVLVFASSGNCATLAYAFCSSLQAPGYMGYPALYDDVVSVGATRADNVRASFSSYGPALDVVSPGSSLTVSTDFTSANGTSAYANNVSGTSFSSPIAAGVASLIISANTNLSTEEVRQILISTSQQPGGSGVFSNEYGFGLISAKRSLENAISNTPANLSRTNKNQPLITDQPGTDPGSPLSPSQAITSKIRSYGGDTVNLEAQNMSTNAKITIVAGIKTGGQSEVDIDWNTSTLGTGSWKIRVQGSQLVSDAKIIYIN